MKVYNMKCTEFTREDGVKTHFSKADNSWRIFSGRSPMKIYNHVKKTWGVTHAPAYAYYEPECMIPTLEQALFLLSTIDSPE